MMVNEEVHLLEDGPSKDFSGKLQLGEDQSLRQGSEQLSNNKYTNQVNSKSKKDVLMPWSGENGEDFFTYQSEKIEEAVRQFVLDIEKQEDVVDILGSWLLTEINLWDNEKERLVILTSKYVLNIKYDFIQMKCLDVKRIPLENFDTIIVGELEYPEHSLIPRLNGLVTGVSGVVKGLLVRPIQDRFTSNNSAPADINANPLALANFQSRSRNMRGLRTMWNQGHPLALTKKWNPFCSDIPWNTYTSHPLMWHKDTSVQENNRFNVDHFAYSLIEAVEKHATSTSCSVEHKPILLENYVGLGSLIHNKCDLGFFKMRGKFNF